MWGDWGATAHDERMHVSMHVSAHARVHARVHACEHGYMHASTAICTRARLYAREHGRTHAFAHARTHLDLLGRFAMFLALRAVPCIVGIQGLLAREEFETLQEVDALSLIHISEPTRPY